MPTDLPPRKTFDQTLVPTVDLWLSQPIGWVIVIFSVGLFLLAISYGLL